MKRLLTLFTLLLLVMSCTKEVDISQGEISGETVSFTATMVDMSETRATLINSWKGGEKVALFVNETCYQYIILADGTMQGDDIIVNSKHNNTYTAFYPYDETLTTIADYQAACTAGNVDYMSATTTTSDIDVNLTFEHQMAALTFTIWIDSIVTDPTLLLTLDGNLSSAVALEFEVATAYLSTRFVANYFVADGTDINSAIIKLEYDGKINVYSIKQENTNTLDAGKQYFYSYTVGELPIGSGSEEDPFIVYTAEDMRKVGTGTDGWALSSHYILAWDIDLGGIDANGNGIAEKAFTAIGSGSYFTGSFDGKGHKISGLYINKPASLSQGLFASISEATIKNIGVSGSVIGKTYVGGIVGLSSSSSIENCYNYCSVKGDGESIGGIIGRQLKLTIKNCYNNGSVEGPKYVGGIVGSNETFATITHCYNLAAVSGNENVGGITGRNFASETSNCYNSAVVSGDENVGGITGLNDGDKPKVSNSYYDSTVAGNIGAVAGADDGTNYCGLTTEMMKGDAETEGTLLNYLNDSTTWGADTNNINNGYPILTWQTSNN